MSYLIGVPLLALMVILQSSLISRLQLLSGRPDLVLLVIISWAFTGRWRETLILALVGGLFLDLMSGLPFGFSAICFVVIAFLVSLFERLLWGSNFLMPIAVTLAASLLYHFAMLGVALLMARSIDVPMAVARVIVPSTFLNLALAIPATQAAQSVRRSVHPPEVTV